MYSLHNIPSHKRTKYRLRTSYPRWTVESLTYVYNYNFIIFWSFSTVYANNSDILSLKGRKNNDDSKINEVNVYTLYPTSVHYEK